MDAGPQLASSFSFLFKPQPTGRATHIQSSASLETPSHTSSEVSLLNSVNLAVKMKRHTGPVQ